MRDAEVDELMDALSDVSAYAHPVGDVEVIRGPTSVVFLAGDRAYKVDRAAGASNGTGATRRACEMELRLNRRLSRGVYLDVVPIVRAVGNGRRGLRFGRPGREDALAIGWAIQMRRLPRDARLDLAVERGWIGPQDAARLGARLARFHTFAARSPEITVSADFSVVRRRLCEGLDRLRPLVGQAITPAMLRRTERALDRRLVQLRPLIERRALEGRPCDTHGDPRLEHIYYLPRPGGLDDFQIIGCEPRERRFADPVSDLAAAVMGLRVRGARNLAVHLVDGYFEQVEDPEGRHLLPLLVAERALERAHLERKALDRAGPRVRRTAVELATRRHAMVALTELCPPSERPCMIMIAGLPGSGKTTLAQGLSSTAGFVHLDADRLCRRLAGVSSEPFPTEAYAPQWAEAVYAECLARAERAVHQGQRIVIDAVFRERSRRLAFVEAAMSWGVPVLLLICEARPGATRNGRWDPLAVRTRSVAHRITTDAGPVRALEQATRILERCALV